MRRKLPELGGIAAHVENIMPRQCHVAHDDGLAGVFVSAAKNVVGAPGWTDFCIGMPKCVLQRIG
jgi:hypothetical protein